MLNIETRYKRSSNIICYWDNGLFCVDNFLSGKHAVVKPVLLPIIEFFNTFKTTDDLESAFPNIPNLKAIIRQLIYFDILIAEGSETLEKETILDSWEWGIEAKHYHLKTNYVDFECNNETVWQNLVSKSKNLVKPPSPFLEIENITYINLPKANDLPKVYFQKVLESRRTCRSFLDREIDLQCLSNLLFYCWGMTGKFNGGDLGDVIFKTTPSGGSRHPIEVYFIANSICNLSSGIYHYNVQKHSIGLLNAGKFNDLGVEICSGQKWVKGASVLFILTAMLKRTMWKYEHSHSFRVINLDAGHLGQTFHLVCQSMDLGPFTTAALNNKLIESLLKINPVEQPAMYLCATGYPDYEIESDE